LTFELGLEADFYGVDCNSFKLDNCVFEAVEDNSDGYRSMLSDIRMKDDVEGLIFFRTPLARVRVEDASDYLRYSFQQPDEPFEGYKLVDVVDGHVWLTFGTEYGDSYYPSFTYYYKTKGEALLDIFES